MGNPAGRPKGAKSKLSESFYSDCLSAYNDPRIGGVEGLVQWITASSRNRMTFYAWLSKTIPSQINAEHTGEGGGPVRVQVERVITRDRDNAGPSGGD